VFTKYLRKSGLGSAKVSPTSSAHGLSRLRTPEP